MRRRGPIRYSDFNPPFRPVPEARPLGCLPVIEAVLLAVATIAVYWFGSL